MKTMPETVGGIGGKLIEAFQDTPADAFRAHFMCQHKGDEPVLNPGFVAGANTIFGATRSSQSVAITKRSGPMAKTFKSAARCNKWALPLSMSRARPFSINARIDSFRGSDELGALAASDGHCRPGDDVAQSRQTGMDADQLLHTNDSCDLAGEGVALFKDRI